LGFREPEIGQVDRKRNRKEQEGNWPRHRTLKVVRGRNQKTNQDREVKYCNMHSETRDLDKNGMLKLRQETGELAKVRTQRTGTGKQRTETQN
jgi:hypothetical protein